jgi:hypothetical protein
MRNRRCPYVAPEGWYCTRGFHEGGPCALTPKWYNIVARWRFR